MQKNNTKIEDYILYDLFEQHALKYEDYFNILNEDGIKTYTPIIKDDNINAEVVKKVSYIFGIPEDAIYKTDKNQSKKWLKKFKFIENLADYQVLEAVSLHGSENFITLLTTGERKSMYDLKDIENRAIDTLKKLNEYIPNTFHENATMKDFRLEINNFIETTDSKLIADMINEMVVVFDRYMELFAKIIHERLTDEEINEYNFLTTFLKVKDRCNNKDCYYDYIYKIKDVIKAENFRQIKSYVNFGFNDFHPWKSPAFLRDFKINNKNLIYLEKYFIYMDNLDVARQFSRNIQKHYCSFVWSDELTYTDNNGEKHENYFKNRTYIYVDKTETELSVYKTEIDVLSYVVGVNGIKRRPLELSDEDFKETLQERLQQRELACGGNE